MIHTRGNSGYWRDLLAGGLVATLVSGIPSTLHALASGGDVTEATRAAGAMILPAHSSFGALFLAAAFVHTAVSFFWAAILVRILPRAHVVLWATSAAAAI